MTAEEFLKTIWICEPPKGHLEVKHVVEAMEQYAKQEKIKDNKSIIKCLKLTKKIATSPDMKTGIDVCIKFMEGSLEDLKK